MERSPLGYFLGEMAYEMRMALRSLVVPLVIVGMTIYMVLIFLNADYMRQMGAVDIYRNSAHLTYLMAAGQSLWLYFAWAWLFAQIVVRDQTAQLHEVVLAAPVPLRLTLLARFCGAAVIAVIMGASIFIGFLLAPVLVWIGALPPEAVGPAPWTAFGWALLVFTLPNAVGTGAVFLATAIWTRSTTGPFSAAAVFALIWMIAMIVLRGGEVDLAAASVLDPAAYAEAERQSMAWTPAEKKTALIEFTSLLIYNRILWLLLPLVLLAWVLKRLRREQLAVTHSGAADETPAPTDRLAGPSSKAGAVPLPALGRPRWIVAFAREWLWQLRLILSSFGMRFALGMLLLIGAVGSWVNFVGHVDGPLVPTPEGLAPFVSEFFFLIIVFVVVGCVGSLMRRDDVQGYDEWLDVSTAPTAVILLAKSLAALTLIALLCMVPAASAVLVTAIGAPQSLDALYPFTYFLLTMFPALAEIGVVALLAHALFRHAGTAYVVSILAGFIAIINHELSVVEYPPAQFGIPTHASPSELVGWRPWLPMVLSMSGLKAAVFAFGVGMSWLLWRRGTALTVGTRLAAARARLLGAPGLLTAAAVISAIGFASLLKQQLVERGEFESTAGQLAGDAAWEQRWWASGTPFSVTGGTVRIALDPAQRTGTADWLLTGLRTRKLHGTLPHGVTLEGAFVDDREVPLEQDEDLFAIVLETCGSGCDLRLRLNVDLEDWPVEAPPWLHRTGVWLRATDILPTLGHDPARLVRAVADRQRHGLAAELPAALPAQALVPAQGVAPAGQWRWQIDSGAGRVVGANGQTNGQLDFAYAWLPDSHRVVERADALVAATRSEQLKRIDESRKALGQCVEAELGAAPQVSAVIQAPRELGETKLHGSLFWLPEDEAFEADVGGAGDWRRQFNLARAMGRQLLLSGQDLRAEAGSRWFLEGVSGWTALRCVERYSGFDVAVALRKRFADELNTSFAELDSPVSTTAEAQGEWIELYAALAFDSWAAGASERPRAAGAPARTPASVAAALSRRGESSLVAAVASTFGSAQAQALLGAPKSSDLAVVQADDQQQLALDRWHWVSGGWQPAALPTRVALLSDTARGGTSRSQWIDLENPVLPSSTKGMLLDARPGFERTLDDNQIGR